MKKIKNLSDYTALNEMAKAFPIGSIAKCVNSGRLGRYEYGYWERGAWDPNQIIGMEGGLFYFKITKSGSQWLEGKILYKNGLRSTTGDMTVRVPVKSVEQTGAEYELLVKNDEEIKNAIGTSIFIEGDEPVLMSVSGNKADVSSGEYTILNLNFKLTDLYDTPVLHAYNKNNSKGFSIKLEDIDKLGKELTVAQREVIASWFAKQTRSEIKLSGTFFQFTTYTVRAAAIPVVGQKLTMDTFLFKDHAEEMLNVAKSLKNPLFDVSTLEIEEYSTRSFDIAGLLVLAKSIGIDTTVTELMKLKRGTVLGKSFGI